MKESTTTENKDVNGGPSASTSNNSVTTASSAPGLKSETKETKPLLKYEYIEKLGDLDDYNGRFGVTPEYPDGTYYYVMSNSFPYIPISFRGAPDKTFIPQGIEIPIQPVPYHKRFNPSHRSLDL